MRKTADRDGRNGKRMVPERMIPPGAVGSRPGRGALAPAAAALSVAALLIGAGSVQAQAGGQERAAPPLAITDATVHTVSGQTLEGATVLVEEGRIAAVGPDVQVPPDARRIDGAGKVVTPGFFDVGTSLGLIEVGAVGDTRDMSMSGDYITAAFDVVDGLNPNSTLIPVNRLGGVTTALSVPSGGLISGQAAVIDLLTGSTSEMLAEPRAAMVASFGPDAADDVGGARGAVSLRLREVFEDARFWRENQAGFQRGASRPLSHSRLDMEALQPVLAGEMPFMVEVDRASDILAVLRLSREYGLRPVIVGGAEAWMVTDSLVAAGTPVVVKPLTNLPTGFATLGARFDNASILHEAGVPLVLTTFDTHNARNLRHEAGNAVRFGLPWEAALRAVTLAPAEAVGVADRYGSIEAGKVANLVVWSGDPFELSTVPEAVVIRGEVVPESSRQRELLERYRDLDRELPPAYTGGRDPARTP